MQTVYKLIVAIFYKSAWDHKYTFVTYHKVQICPIFFQWPHRLFPANPKTALPAPAPVSLPGQSFSGNTQSRYLFLKLFDLGKQICSISISIVFMA